MKKKVRVKSLPKAQVGTQQPPMVLTPQQKAIWQKNQGMFGANYKLDTPKVFDNSASFKLGEPKVFDNVNNIPAQGIKSYSTYPSIGSMQSVSLTSDSPKAFENANVNPFNKPPKLSLYPRNTKFESGILSTGDAIKKTNLDKIPEDTRKLMGLEPFGDIKTKKPEQQKGNPYVGQAILAGTDIFRGLANQIDNRFAKRDLRDQFLSDNLAYAREEGQSGNRGDYNFNEFGFGPSFRPDDYIKGDYNKEAQMGGEMKRKVKITSLPQAGYGGSQNQNAVNQLYGNSAYMVNKFSGAEQEEQEPAYNQTLQPDPRSMSVLEAEKGETLIRKGTNSAIPEFFKIGGKRHSEGGTPLSGEKATPDSFIYSDTKAMKIKDPAILESFGFAAKKGGYTPAKISKKFDLNSKELREGLYSDSDPLRKKTAVMMADNYISNLGKLALVQESQKGFPQGVPQIAMPYMNKVGLDPAQFLPPSPEEGMAMAMYGGIPKAQVGRQQIGTYYNTEIGKVLPIYNFEENRSGLDNGPRLLFPTQGELIKSGVDYLTEAQRKKIALLNYEKAKAANEVVPQTIQPVATPQSAPVTQKARPAAQTPKPKVNVAKPSTGFIAPDGSIIEFEYGGESLYQTGGEKGTFLAKHTDASGKEYSSYLQGDKVVLVDSNNEVVSTRPATEKDRPAISTYDKEAEDILRKIKPDIILNKDYVEGTQRGADAKIPGTYGRFEKDAADKNWSWYGKPINWTNKPELKQVQKAYNKEMYNRFINADYTPEEAAKYVKLIGFDESKEEGQTANDGKPGKWTETRVVFDVPKKPGKDFDGDIIFLKKIEFDIFYSCKYKYPILVKETITRNTGFTDITEEKIDRSLIF